MAKQLAPAARRVLVSAIPPAPLVRLAIVVMPGNQFQNVDTSMAAWKRSKAIAMGSETDSENLSSGNEGANTAPPLPDKLVGDQSDPRAGPNKGGGKNTSGTLTPENGGNGDFLNDLDVLAGPVRPQQPGDKAPPGSLVGGNGVFGRPDNKTGGSSIDIPANGTKPHETLHYPWK